MWRSVKLTLYLLDCQFKNFTLERKIPTDFFSFQGNFFDTLPNFFLVAAASHSPNVLFTHEKRIPHLLSVTRYFAKEIPFAKHEIQQKLGWITKIVPNKTSKY